LENGLAYCGTKFITSAKKFNSSRPCKIKLKIDFVKNRKMNKCVNRDINFLSKFSKLLPSKKKIGKNNSRLQGVSKYPFFQMGWWAGEWACPTIACLAKPACNPN
jgi:hypothetical protein